MPATKNLEKFYMSRPVANITTLKAINTTGIATGLTAIVVDYGLYIFNSTSTATADDIDIVQPTTGPGRWNRTEAAVVLNPMITPQSDADGAIYYDSATNKFQFRENGVWIGLAQDAGLVTSPNSTSLAGGVTGAHSNTVGIYNTTYGMNAANASGSSAVKNTAIGAGALASNVSSDDNTAIGYGALYSNTAEYNTAIGAGAMNSNTTGTKNVAVGWAAGSANNGDNNITIGYASSLFNATGSNNTVVGTYASQTNTSSSNVTAVGYNALKMSTAADNTAMGSGALEANTTGARNTVVGSESVAENLIADDITAVGYYALSKNTSSGNTAIGSGALLLNTTGKPNTAIGFNAGNDVTTATNITLLGHSTLLDAHGNNSCIVGNTTQTVYMDGLGLETAGPINTDNALTVTPTSANTEFYATYERTINLNYGAGNKIFAAENGAAIVAGKLDLTGSTNKRIRGSATGNFVGGQVGAIKCKYTPNYSGTPASPQVILNISNATNSNWRLVFFHNSVNQAMYLSLFRENSTNIFSTYHLGVWNPTSGTTYELEVNWDLTTGATRLFVNGNQIGSTLASTATYSPTGLTTILVGTEYLLVSSANFSIEDLIVYNTVQHTANYTPGYTLYDDAARIASTDSMLNNALLLGSVTAPGVYSTTTADAANVVVSAAGILERSTALPRYGEMYNANYISKLLPNIGAVNFQTPFYGVFMAGLLSNFTFAAGTGGSIASFAIGGDLTLSVTTSAAHGLTTGDGVLIYAGSVGSYDSFYSIVVTGANTFNVFGITFSGTETASWTTADRLICGISGKYKINYSLSARYNGATANKFTVVPTINPCKVLYNPYPTVLSSDLDHVLELPTGTGLGCLVQDKDTTISGSCLVDLVAGDQVCLTISSMDGPLDFTDIVVSLNITHVL